MSNISLIDPSEYKLNILGIDVKGFSKGTFITVSRQDPHFSQRKSLKGRTIVFNNRHSSYTFNFVLDGSTSSNLWLHTIAKLLYTYGIVFPIPVLFSDKLGTSTFFCKAAYIQEPNLSLGTDVQQTSWDLVCNDVSLVIGTNEQDNTLASILSTLSTVIGITSAVGVSVSSLTDTAANLLTAASNSVRNLLSG